MRQGLCNGTDRCPSVRLSQLSTAAALCRSIVSSGALNSTPTNQPTLRRVCCCQPGKLLIDRLRAHDVTTETYYIGCRIRYSCSTHISALTFDVPFQSPAIYGHDPYTNKNKARVQKIEWKQPRGQTDMTDCTTFPANSLSN